MPHIIEGNGLPTGMPGIRNDNRYAGSLVALAVIFYAVGLLYALVAVVAGARILRKIALPSMSLGMVFNLWLWPRKVC